jgi:hypothetical protein
MPCDQEKKSPKMKETWRLLNIEGMMVGGWGITKCNTE